MIPVHATLRLDVLRAEDSITTKQKTRGPFANCRSGRSALEMEEGEPVDMMNEKWVSDTYRLRIRTVPSH